MSGSASTTNRRRRRFVRPDVQLKVVFIAAFVSCLTLVVQTQLSLAGVGDIAQNLGDGLTSFETLELVESVTARSFGLAVLVALPLSIVVGILYSFRFAGPLFRIQRHLDGLRNGPWHERCVLRRGDDLQDMADSLNATVDAARERIGEDQAILQDMRDLLTHAVFTTDAGSRDQVAHLLRRIEVSADAYGKRFAGAETVTVHRDEGRDADTGAGVASADDSAEADVEALQGEPPVTSQQP